MSEGKVDGGDRVRVLAKWLAWIGCDVREFKGGLCYENDGLHCHTRGECLAWHKRACVKLSGLLIEELTVRAGDEIAAADFSEPQGAQTIGKAVQGMLRDAVLDTAPAN